MITLDAGITENIFHKKYMDIMLVNRLQTVSNDFYRCAQKYKRSLRQIDVNILCNNYAFEDLIVRQYAEWCPNLTSIRNVEITSGKVDCMETLSAMSNITKLHLISFQLSDFNFACLLKLPITDLSIDRLFFDEAFDLIRFKNDVGQPRMNLIRLQIKRFGEFHALCKWEQLTSLSLVVDIFDEEHNSVSTAYGNLRRCIKLKTLHLDLGSFFIQDIQACVQAISSLRDLVDFSLMMHYWPENLPDILNKFCRDVTKLTCSNDVGIEVCTPFANLRHLVSHNLELDPYLVFGSLVNLQSLIIENVNSFMNNFYSYGYKIGLSIHTVVDRFVKFER